VKPILTSSFQSPSQPLQEFSTTVDKEKGRDRHCNFFFEVKTMKRFWRRLSSYWFTTMVPVSGPLNTIDARETLRKRRLLSRILLILALIGLFFAVQGLFGGTTFSVLTSLPGVCIPLCALWINQRGYLKWASSLYLIFLFITLLPIILASDPSNPVSSLSTWPVLLLLPVISGLLLPAWGPLVLCVLEIVFMGWFVQYDSHSHLASFVPDPAARFQFLCFACALILMTAIFSAISASTTKKAVIQADRTVELEQAYAELETAHAIIQQQALTDGLTGLPNHRAMMELLHNELQRARRYSRPFSVLFFDADRFKRVNDTHGHAAGDAVLRQIGERAISALRGGDTLGRFGGEEFIVLLPEADAREAWTIAERLRLAVVAEPLAIAEVQGGLAVTVSIGLSTYPVDAHDEQRLIQAADEAMYLAKRLGRNQIRTTEEAQQMGRDVELMLLLQREEQHEAQQREGATAEVLRERYTWQIISSLVSLLQSRDPSLGNHVYAVKELATTIAQKLDLDLRTVNQIGMAALLHDIGKVAIPEHLLKKTGALSSNERRLLQEHVELGTQILEANPFLADFMPAVRHHHERWDGTGFPDHLATQEIPLAARIIAVAETYDFMQRETPYHTSSTPQEALVELKRCAGTQFDPQVVQALQENLIENEMVSLKAASV
jgi:diguanylate cyclase (GGDEF)-like protein/putative nucleotidyltransferase with HDIG domain